MSRKASLSCIIFSTLFALLPFAKLNSQDAETVKKDSLDIHDKLLMERITVVGTPVWMSTIPGAATYIDSRELENQRYTDINRVLRSVSGIYIQEEDGFGLRPNIGLRGAGSERSTKVNIMEDGILAAPAPYSAPAAYYFPNVGRMNSIEVRKGSSQVKFGPNTTGGAINLISTPIPTELSAHTNISVGERSSSRVYANFGNRTERFGYLLEATHIGDEGFKKLDDGGETGFRILDLLGKFMIRSSSDASIFQRLEIKAGYHDELSDETYLGLTRDDFQKSPNRRYAASQVDQMDTEHTQLMARHFVLFSDNIDLTTSVYRNDFSRTWYKLHDLNSDLPTIETGNLSTILNNPESYPLELGYLRGETSPNDALTVRNNNREYYTQGLESILGVSFDLGSATNQLEAGIRLHQDQEDRFQFEDDYRMENGVMILTSKGIPGTQANRIGSATALSLFVQDEIRYDRWTFTPGLRFENIWFRNRNYGSNDLDRTGIQLQENTNTVRVLIPGMGVSFLVTDHLSLISGIHKGFSPPSPGSSSETRAESSVNYEFGGRYNHSAMQVELIGFYSDYSNLLGSDLAAGGGTGTTAQFNAGSVEVYGLEATANIDLVELFNIDSASFSLPLSANYTYTSASFLTSFESDFTPWGTVEAGDKIPFIPEHQFRSGITFNYKGFSTDLNTIYTPKMRTVAGSGPIDERNSTDSYLLFDLSTGFDLMQYVNLFINVRNLLDKTYIVSDRPSGVRPGLPRTVMAGMSLDF